MQYISKLLQNLNFYKKKFNACMKKTQTNRVNSQEQKQLAIIYF